MARGRVQPRGGVAKTAGVATARKLGLQCATNKKRAEYRPTCPFCGVQFVTTNPQKRYCCDRHQRNAAKARYRARHTEPATRKGCGASIERTTSSKRMKVYCSLNCQYRARSGSYQQRPDLRENVRRAARGAHDVLRLLPALPGST